MALLQLLPMAPREREREGEQNWGKLPSRNRHGKCKKMLPLSRTDLFTIVTPSFHEHWMTFSFLCLLQFHRYYIVFIVDLIPLICWTYSCVVVVAIVSQIAILICISDISVLIRNKVTGFSMLTLYLLPSLKSFISPNNFWVGSVWGLWCMICKQSLLMWIPSFFLSLASLSHL